MGSITLYSSVMEKLIEKKLKNILVGIRYGLILVLYGVRFSNNQKMFLLFR